MVSFTPLTPTPLQRTSTRFTPLEVQGERPLVPGRPDTFTGNESKVTLFVGENAAKLPPGHPLQTAKDIAGPDLANMGSAFNETGWFIGLDGKWRKEIDDSQATFNSEFTGKSTLAEQLNHPALLAAYPEIGKIEVLMDETLVGTTTAGGFHENKGENGLLVVRPGQTASKIMEIVIHELQHTVQKAEGFSRGGSPWSDESKEILSILRSDKTLVAEWGAYNELDAAAKVGVPKPKGVDPYPGNEANLWSGDGSLLEIYRRYAGEVEARQAGNRVKFTPIERREQHPSLSRDVEDVDVLNIESMRDR